MGFGPFSSESTSRADTRQNDSRTIADGNGVAYSPHVSVGDDGNALGEGATQFNTRGGALHLEYSSDPDLLRSAIDAVNDQAVGFQNSLVGIFAAASDAQSAQALGNAVAQKSILDQTFSNLADLAKSAQSGGETDRNKIVLYVSVAALAVVGAAFLFRK